MLDGLLRHRGDDPLIRLHQVVAALPGLPRDAGRDDDNGRVGRLLVAVRPRHPRLVPEHGAGLIDVERLSLGQPFDDVDDDDVRVVAPGKLLCDRRADIAGADHGHLPALAHTGTASLSMIASATSLVPTAVGSSRVGFMSYVTLRPSAITAAMAPSRLLAAERSPRCCSIITPESIIAIGLTLFWPVYFGAEPCVGSKTAACVPKFAPGARPSPPTKPAARSDTMSP